MDASFEPTLNIMAAYPILKDEYGIKLQEHDFLEKAYQAFKDINSIPVKYYKYVQKPQSGDTMILDVPCNLYKLLSLTTTPLHDDGYDDLEPYKYTRYEVDSNKEFMNTVLGNSDLKTYHFNDSPNVGLGTYLQYEWIDETALKLYDENLFDTEIYMIYEGIEVDDKGLPKITRKHANAIAAKVALMVTKKKMFKGDPAAAQILPWITQESARLIQSAAIPEAITDNQLDEMLNEMKRFDRKRYNRSFKFRR